MATNIFPKKLILPLSFPLYFYENCLFYLSKYSYFSPFHHHDCCLSLSTLNQMNVNSHLASFFSSRLLPFAVYCTFASLLIFCLLYIPWSTKGNTCKGPKAKNTTSEFICLFVCGLWSNQRIYINTFVLRLSFKIYHEDTQW